VSKFQHAVQFVFGVFGRLPDFSLLSDEAFKMEKLHIRESSTDIKAPELSNSPQ
jgi:hypothetical protein